MSIIFSLLLISWSIFYWRHNVLNKIAFLLYTNIQYNRDHWHNLLSRLGRIPEQFIDELISRTDIAEIIDHRVPLQRAGSEFRACCPFHNEKTPSFYVSPVKQFYHCFGCGAHGTAISFLMNYDNMEFLDAVDALASQAGMVVPKDAQPDEGAREERASLHEIIERANEWYQAQLKQHPDAPQAVEYLKNRGLDGKTAAAFGVGFAPQGWDNLSKAIGADEAKLKLLADAGLAIEKDEGGYYDRFRERVMFPIEDYRGKLIGFGGRVIGKGEPKYLNSPETKLFHKGSELYGFHRARREIGQRDEVVVVEGYMDVVGLAQCGVPHAVATLGTATTPAHLQRLFRAASKVIFCFDGDRAGRKAAWRAMEIAIPFMQDGRQIKFLLLPDGEDPDSLIRQEGLAAFEQRIVDATALNAFLFDSLTAKLDMSQMDQRAKLATQARPLIQKLPQGNFKSMMYAHLSELVGVTQHEEASAPPVEYQEHFSAAPSTAPSAATPPAQEEMRLHEHVQAAICSLLQKPGLVEIANEFELDTKQSAAGIELLDQLIGMINVQPEINTAQLIERLRDSRHIEKLSQLAIKDLMLEEDQQETYLRDTMVRLERQQLEQQIDSLLQQGLKNLTPTERDHLNALYQRKAKATA